MSYTLRFSMDCAFSASLPWPTLTASQGRVWRRLPLQGALRDDWAKSTVWEILMCKSERHYLTMRLMVALVCFWLWNEKADTVWGAPCRHGKPQASESPGPPNMWIYFFHTLVSSSSNSFTYSLYTFLLLTVLWVPIKQCTCTYNINNNNSNHCLYS